MKIGIITASLPMELRAALKKAKEIGAHGVQLCVANNELDPRNLSQTGRQELLSFMASLGLRRAALCGDLGGFVDPATVDERVAHTREMFDLCVDLKTPILTTHIGRVPEDTSSRAYRDLVAVVRGLAQYAAERGCCLATETGPEAGDFLAAFLRAVNSPGAKVNFDPANLCMSGFDHFHDAVALKDLIVHTHAKDALRGKPEEVALGLGDVDFPRYLAILRDNGFNGYLTIERECGANPIADIIEAICFLKRQEGVEH